MCKIKSKHSKENIIITHHESREEIFKQTQVVIVKKNIEWATIK